MILTNGNTVVIPNTDGKIWDIEYKIIDIIKSYNLHDSVTISLNGEGPCAESLGLYKLLDHLCDAMNYKKSNISILTNNVIEEHSKYNIKKSGPLYLDSIKDFAKKNKFQDKNFDNIKHFGLFVGRSNWMRIWMASKILNEYKDKSLLTYHYNSKLPFHKDHLGLDNCVQFNIPVEDVINAVHLVNVSPVLLENEIPDYPIISPAHFNISKIYHEFFLEIVCETYCQGNTFYPTEKIWRPILMKTPFIIQGPKNYYKNLQKMGFKTFSNWWDEGFTNDTYDYQIYEINKVIERISLLTTEELEGIYIDMQETLNHNYNLLMRLNPTDFVKKFND